MTDYTQKMLFVEDDEENANAALPVFEEAGYEVVHEEDYRSAKDTFDDGDFDVVVSDVHYPEETGSGNRDLGRDVLEEYVRKTDTGEVYAAAEHALESRQVEDVKEFYRKKGELLEEDNSKMINSLERYERVSDQASDGILEDVEMYVENWSPMEAPFAEVDATQRRFDLQERGTEAYENAKEAIEEDESQQPLGLRLAERTAEEVPTILATSGGHHFNLARDVYREATDVPLQYADENHRHQKTDAEFWEKTLDVLEGSNVGSL